MFINRSAFVVSMCLISALTIFNQLKAMSTEPSKENEKQEIGTFLTNPQSITVYSLEPSILGTANKPEKDMFYGRKILGRTGVAHAEIENLASAIKTGIGSGSRTRCGFEPHHGLSVLTKEHKFDIVICFFCGDVRCYKDGEWFLDQTVKREGGAIGDLEKKLNAILVTAKIPQSRGYNTHRKFYLQPSK